MRCMNVCVFYCTCITIHTLFLVECCNIQCTLQDAVTDMSAESDPLEMIQDAKGHRGILQAAKYIKEQLLGKGILEAAFQQAQVHVKL